MYYATNFMYSTMDIAMCSYETSYNPNPKPNTNVPFVFQLKGSSQW